MIGSYKTPHVTSRLQLSRVLPREDFRPQRKTKCRIALTLLLPHQLQCQVLVRLKIPVDAAQSGSRCLRHTAGVGRWGNSFCSICVSFQSSGNGHGTPAVCAADMYSWTVL